MRRRSFLAGAAATAGLLGVPTAFGSIPGSPRLVVLLLRGGLDGLSVVPAVGDPDYRRVRGDLAMPGVGEPDGPLGLDGTFAMHPALAPLVPLYEAGDLGWIHATAIPYVGRSHFDGQDVLENGTTTALGTPTGWLGRALAALGTPPPALAVGRTVPLILRGDAPVTSADPLAERRIHPWIEEVRRLYSDDRLLGPALESGLAVQETLAAHRSPADGRSDTAMAAEVVAGVMSDPDGPRVAVLQFGGWDTHAQQANVLQRELTGLGGAVSAFAEATAPEIWAQTVVLGVTEFGRTVHVNGTGGTDHGIGGAALIAGGAVAGGRVVADWPGLAARDLVDGRDLRATLDLRTVFAGILGDHLCLTSRQLASVFDDVAPRRGLIG